LSAECKTAIYPYKHYGNRELIDLVKKLSLPAQDNSPALPERIELSD
jgi:hypothetical protein